MVFKCLGKGKRIIITDCGSDCLYRQLASRKQPGAFFHAEIQQVFLRGDTHQLLKDGSQIGAVDSYVIGQRGHGDLSIVLMDIVNGVGHVGLR